MAFMKGLIDINKYNFSKFIVVRLLLNFMEPIKVWLISEMMAWIASGEAETLEQTVYMFCFGMLIPLSRVTQHTIWEYFCF